MQYGQLAAGTALISGTKNEEMSAAYLLMQLYPVPAKRWDEERSWVYLGVAIRYPQLIFKLPIPLFSNSNTGLPRTLT